LWQRAINQQQDRRNRLTCELQPPLQRRFGVSRAPSNRRNASIEYKGKRIGPLATPPRNNDSYKDHTRSYVSNIIHWRTTKACRNKR
jgi:hypothetical protein